MTRNLEPITEIDLLAYADGLLDGDIARKKEVERYLSARPEAAAYIAEIQQQNEAIRDRFGPLLEEPVPERLTAMLHSRPPRSHRKTLAQAAVIVFLVLTSTGGGWLIGQRDASDDWEVAEFVESAAAFHQTGMTVGDASASVVDNNPLQPLGWLNRRIALELAAPNLTTDGFDLVAKERIGAAEDPMVRLIYRRSDGTTINLFLRPRWEDHATRMSSAEADDVTVHSWLDGPLAFAMTTDAPRPEMEHLANVVRQAVGRARLSDETPSMALSPGAVGQGEQLGEGDSSLVPPPDGGAGQQRLQVN